MTRRCFLFSLSFFFSLSAFAQTLTGSVSDPDGEPIAFASIQIAGSRAGTITNTDGQFQLNLAAGTYQLMIKHLGYGEKVVAVNVPDSQPLEVVLLPVEMELDEIEIERGRRDPAYAIMKQVIKHKKQFIQQFEGYKCDTYQRISLVQDSTTARRAAEKRKKAAEERRKKKIDSLAQVEVADTLTVGLDSLGFVIEHDSIPADTMWIDTGEITLSIKPQTINFVESQSTTYYRHPKQYKTIVNAYRSRSRNGGGISSSFNFNENAGHYRTPARDPYLFYQDVSDVEMNFYRNLIQAPKLGDRPFVSPLHSTLWAITYRYHLDSTYYVKGKVHYTISITPKNLDGPYFKGKFIIVDGSWAIQSVRFEVLPSTLPFFKQFEVAHDYSKTDDGRWVLDKEEYTYTVKDGPSTYEGQSLALHTAYELDPELPRNFFRNELRRTDKEAFERDSSYWAGVRPMAMEERDIQFVKRQDSLIAHYRSPEHLREVDSIFNHLSFLDILVNGIAFRDRKRGMRYYFSPILEQIQPYGVGGYRHSLGTSIRKTWKNYTAMYLWGDFNYGVDNKDLKGNFRLGYTYNPRKFAHAYIKVGDTYSMVNDNATLIALLGRGNYINKRSIGVGHRMEVTNGIFVDASIDFADRKAIDELELSQWSEDLFGEFNVPQSFDPYREFLFDIKVRFIPGQKYQLEPYRKINLGSKWPTFTLHYKKAIAGILNSELNFDYLGLRVNHEFRPATLGISRWSVNIGRFLQANNIRFTDFTFFRGSDPYLFANPLRSFQLLGPTISTQNAFFDGHYLHDFGGALMDRIPLLKRTRLQSAGGGALLLIEDGSFFHAELFAGLQYPFRIRKQLLKFGTYFVTSYSNAEDAIKTQVKIGLTFFNPIEGRWAY